MLGHVRAGADFSPCCDYVFLSFYIKGECLLFTRATRFSDAKLMRPHSAGMFRRFSHCFSIRWYGHRKSMKPESGRAYFATGRAFRQPLVSPSRLELPQRGQHLRGLRDKISPHAVLVVERQTETLRFGADLSENLRRREKERSGGGRERMKNGEARAAVETTWKGRHFVPAVCPCRRCE